MASLARALACAASGSVAWAVVESDVAYTGGQRKLEVALREMMAASGGPPEPEAYVAPPTPEPLPLYDCTAEYYDWKRLWTPEWKRWCCANKKRGCESEQAPPAPAAPPAFAAPKALPTPAAPPAPEAPPAPPALDAPKAPVAPEAALEAATAESTTAKPTATATTPAPSTAKASTTEEELVKTVTAKAAAKAKPSENAAAATEKAADEDTTKAATKVAEAKAATAKVVVKAAAVADTKADAKVDEKAVAEKATVKEATAKAVAKATEASATAAKADSVDPTAAPPFEACEEMCTFEGKQFSCRDRMHWALSHYVDDADNKCEAAHALVEKQCGSVCSSCTRRAAGMQGAMCAELYQKDDASYHLRQPQRAPSVWAFAMVAGVAASASALLFAAFTRGATRSFRHSTYQEVTRPLQ
mmetsp:Transcript_90777/g.261563  ORF Transcript_90777/g.261563 Transcript_90777/m.261563 type:complete len:416 (-) Transcript_90777:186-1433(-)